MYVWFLRAFCILGGLYAGVLLGNDYNPLSYTCLVQDVFDTSRQPLLYVSYSNTMAIIAYI